VTLKMPDHRALIRTSLTCIVGVVVCWIASFKLPFVCSTAACQGIAPFIFASAGCVFGALIHVRRKDVWWVLLLVAAVVFALSTQIAFDIIDIWQFRATNPNAPKDPDSWVKWAIMGGILGGMLKFVFLCWVQVPFCFVLLAIVRAADGWIRIQLDGDAH
jgi:hypothetical protein